MPKDILTKPADKTTAVAEAPARAQESAHSQQNGHSRILQLHGALGNRKVAELLRARAITSDGKLVPIQRKPAPAPSVIPPQASPTLARKAAGTLHVQRAWYNFDIPFTDYQFDPSLEGIKTAANVVKDTATAGLDWIVDEIKGAISSGADWLRDQWHSVEELATSSLDAAKNSLANILNFVKRPLGILADSLTSLDAQGLAKAWATFSGLISTTANGFKAMTDGLLQKINQLWGGIDGFATSLLNRVAGLTGNFLFKKLPDALQNLAIRLVNQLKALWKSINDGWDALFKKVKTWVDRAIDQVFSLVRRVLSFGINVIIAGIVDLGKLVFFLRDFFAHPKKYVDQLAQRSVKAFDPVEGHFAGLLKQHFGTTQVAAPPQAAGTKVQRAPGPGATAEAKRSASFGEIGHGIGQMMGQKWDAFKANPLSIVTGLLMDMVFPLLGDAKDVIQLFKDIKKVATGPLSADSLEDLWTSLLLLLNIPLLIYKAVVSILMRTLMLPLIIATFIPHPLVKAIAAAVGYGLLGSFLQGELLSMQQKLLLLKTGATIQSQKEDAYNSIADSLIALAMTAVIIVVMLILQFIANVMKGVFSFVKGKVFTIEPVAPEGEGKTPGESKSPLDKGEGAKSTTVKEGIPSEDGQRKIRMNDKGKCEVCASPCDDIRQKYSSIMTPEIEAKIKLIEDDPSLSDVQKEEKLKPIEQELSDLQKKNPAPVGERRVIKLDSPARIKATEPVKSGNILNWRLFDSESGAEFADVDVDISDPEHPGAPDQKLTPKEAKLKTGEIVKLEADFSFTEESLKKNQATWEEHFKKPLLDYSGSLAKENLGNFQFEFGEARTNNPGLSTQEVGNLAIRKVSFGKGRISVGFGDLSVKMGGVEDVTIKEGKHAGKTVTDAPTTVSVSAKRTAPLK